MFFSNISLFFCILLNVKLNTVFIIMKYLIIAKKHPDELMSKSTNVRLSFYIFMQKILDVVLVEKARSVQTS